MNCDEYVFAWFTEIPLFTAAVSTLRPGRLFRYMKLFAVLLYTSLPWLPRKLSERLQFL